MTENTEKEKEKTFEQELSALINAHSLESGSDTPDFILAQYMSDCLETFNQAMINRSAWYTRSVD